jgi:serine/threonine protein kinase
VNGTDLGLPDPGTSGKVAGYQLGEWIGEGDVAVVRLARDERLNREAAVKIFAPELAGDAAFRARILSESRAAAAIGHPHIVPVYGAGDAGGTLYVAMRHVTGGNAWSLLSRHGPLPSSWAWSVIAQIASALDAAHGHGLIHRDVKPANMLLDADGGAGGRIPDRAERGCGHAYLSDFGMGRDLSPAEIIAAGQFAGPLDYLAPEQIQGRALDGRADLYALACAGFELLCGMPPFGLDQGLTVMYAQLYAPPPAATARRPDLPAAVDLVLATALAKNPADRYPTCGQFAEELRTALGLLAGGPDDPARLRSLGRAGSGAESRLASGRHRPARQHESVHEPAQTLAPVQSGPGRPRSPEDQPSAGPGQASPDSVRGPGRPYPRQPWHRPGVIGLIFALAVVCIAAIVVIGVVLSARPARGRPAASSPAATSPRSSSSAPPSPSASTLASRQAAAVNDLLSSSAATRRLLQGAVSEASDCTDLSGAVSQIQNAVNQRSTEYNQASALSTSALADGAIVKTDLSAALRNSLNADRDYLAWAQQQLTLGCAPATQSSAYAAAYNADQQADAAKEAFVQVWNPVAARYGIQQESPGSI